jgi:hypothetical protein
MPQAGPDGEADAGMGNKASPMLDGDNLDANSQGSEDIPQELKHHGARASGWQV